MNGVDEKMMDVRHLRLLIWLLQSYEDAANGKVCPLSVQKKRVFLKSVGENAGEKLMGVKQLGLLIEKAYEVAAKGSYFSF